MARLHVGRGCEKFGQRGCRAEVMTQWKMMGRRRNEVVEGDSDAWVVIVCLFAILK